MLAEADITDDVEPVMSVTEAISQTAARFDELSEEAAAQDRNEEAEILEAYAMIVDDPVLTEAIEGRLSDGGTAVAAIRGAIAEVAAAFQAMDDEYLAQRADDVEGVGRELLATVTGARNARAEMPDGAIICARDLTPADTVQLDLTRVGGLATERGGTTSHTAIVARAVGIPAVVGATGLLDELAQDATLVLVDGDRGEVIVDPDADTVTAAQRRIEQAESQAVEHRRLRGTHVTFDAERVLVAANVGGSADLDAAVATQADGIGLFRSEFLFLERNDPPPYEEQHEAYAKAVQAFEDPTVVRTLDIGGDKEVPYLALDAEENPFLGVRGLRLCLARPDLFSVQLDALIAAAEDGRLRIMFPMVASVADLDAGLAYLAERARIAGTKPPATGIMIETPAAALLAPHLARRSDFFSIGTNDLVQYTAAADRGLSELAPYHDPAQPAVLQLIQTTCQAASDAGIPVAVCGEAASDPVTAALLLGLGVRELSVSPSLVDRIRWLVTQLDPVAVERTAREATLAPDADAVRELVTPLLP